LRAIGGWDGFELGVRAILGQQVSVEAARKLASRLVAIAGRRLPRGSEPLTHAFPSPADVVASDLGALGMPGARKKALVALARAAIAEPRLFQPGATLEDTLDRLQTIPGVGPWTAHYIALRGAREPDAFPASDRGLLRAAARRSGKTVTPSALEERAERWRPFRGYAAQHLWAADATTGV
jgi:AraC family transcriptional regulator of adaptative response / DNA-3-methyladenine glycosylase II